MKHLLPFFIGLTLIASGGVLVAHAQGYTPLVSLPGATQEGVSTNMSAYLSGVIKLLIALGGAISILMAIIGGTQYVAAGIAPSAKEDAKNRITNAFIGLALILASYLILNSINPKLVQFGFMLPPVGTSPMATSTGVAGSGVHTPLPVVALPVNPFLHPVSTPMNGSFVTAAASGVSVSPTTQVQNQ